MCSSVFSVFSHRPIDEDRHPSSSNMEVVAGLVSTVCFVYGLFSGNAVLFLIGLVGFCGLIAYRISLLDRVTVITEEEIPRHTYRSFFYRPSPILVRDHDFDCRVIPPPTYRSHFPMGLRSGQPPSVSTFSSSFSPFGGIVPPPTAQGRDTVGHRGQGSSIPSRRVSPPPAYSPCAHTGPSIVPPPSSQGRFPVGMRSAVPACNSSPVVTGRVTSSPTVIPTPTQVGRIAVGKRPGS